MLPIQKQKFFVFVNIICELVQKVNNFFNKTICRGNNLLALKIIGMFCHSYVNKLTQFLKSMRLHRFKNNFIVKI